MASNQTRQEDEFQAIQAIFPDCVEDLRKPHPWKAWVPLELKMTLRPQESGGGPTKHYVQVDLIIKCSSDYPNRAPALTLENSKGLSNEQLDCLNKELKKIASKLESQSEEMIMNLALHVQNFLHLHNNPPVESFYEQMVSRQRQCEESRERQRLQELEHARMLEEKRNAEIQDELNRQQEALRDAWKQQKAEADTKNNSSNSSSSSPDPTTPRKSFHRSRSSTSPAGSTDSRNRRMSTPRRFSEREDDSCCTQHSGVVRIVFNTKPERIVDRGRCTRHDDRGSTVFNGVDSKTGSLVTIREWLMRWRCMGEGDEDPEASKLKKQLQSIESEMKTLIHLRSPTLVPYLGMNCSHDPRQVTVHVLSDFTGECSLEGMYLQRGEPVPLPLLRHYTQDLVDALDFLHANDIVHKDLRAASVFIDGNGQARLADFSVVKRLYDLYQSVEKGKPRVHFPDSQPTLFGRVSKKGDVYLLGLLLLSLAQGEEVTDPYPKAPDSLHQTFQDFLAKCLVELDKDRPSPRQLLQHRFLKEPLSLSLRDVSSLEDSAKSLAKSSGQSRQEEEEDKDDVPLLTTLELCGKSRITQEFEILRSLGKGGYGDVVKVKNRLDDKCYAIKRVRLVPKSKNFNKKILREVQLLSSLNHENVVRYYNSWIERSQETSSGSDSSTLSSRTTETKESPPKTAAASLDNGIHVNSLGLVDDIEQFAPQMAETSASWTTSLSLGQVAEPESDDDDSDDENNIFGISFRPESSTSVVFGSSSDSSSDNEESPDGNKGKQVTTLAAKKPPEPEEKAVPEPEEQNLVEFLYIQMEYCEKSTLRNVIDDSLFTKPNRKWRLFREIVEGLTHIHSKNLIHRDLKPVNIFLDSDDHVKIGDFGLATTRMDHKGPKDPAALIADEIADLMQSPSADGNLTGRVGTALYVSPEMMSDTKVIYDEKVDIYSLGIIFFEMSYKPLSTGMERVKILGQLRQNPAVFPEDFDEQQENREARILKWLLNHNPHDRPTAQQLLHCDALPPPQLEETKMNEIIRATFSTKRTKLYHRMVEAMFEQKVDKTTELVYELDINKDLSVGTLLTQQMVREELEWLFSRHGAVPVSLPLLLPKVDLRRVTPQSADFMDTSGTIVCLPYELRVSFARYVAKHNIQHLKRYTMDRVFRTAKRSGHHPKEIVECAYDIITPHSSTQDKAKHFPDVEVLCLAQEVVKKFPPLKARNYYIKINHMALLRGILLHCGVPEDKMDTVLYQLDAQPDLWQKPRELMKSCELTLSDQHFGPMNNLLGREDNFREISAAMKLITRTKTQASMMVKSGLQELVDILDLAKCYGLRLEVRVAPGLIFHPRQYSGMVFQVVYNRMRKNNIITEPLAAGGRYDELVKYFFKHFIGPLGAARGMNSQLGVPTVAPQAVGISFAYNNITAAFTASKDQKEQQELMERPTLYDVLVCAQTNKVAASERLVVLGKLIPEGIKAEVKAEPLEDSDSLVAECKMSGCSQVVILQDPDYNQGFVTVRSLEADGQTITAKKVPLSNLPSHLKLKISQTSKVESTEDRQPSGKGGHMEWGSKSGTVSSASSSISLNVTFIEAKMAYNTRKRMEGLIQGKVNAAFSWVPVKILEVISGDFDLNCLQMMSAFLVLDGDEAAFEASAESILERVTQQKTKKFLRQVTDKICELRFDKKCQFIVLYSQKADNLKLLY